MQKSFKFDLNKCTGCQACAIACSIENELDFGKSWREVHTFNSAHNPDLPLYHLSLACNHCLDAPCEKYCPAMAITKNEQTGVVLINEKHCIGCKYCSWVCPFDAPKYNSREGIMEKCTFCSHRLDEELKPACVSICPTDALEFIKYKEEGKSPNINGFPSTTIKPAIELVPLRGKQFIPKMFALPYDENLIAQFESAEKKYMNKISLKSEWHLIIFTLLVPFLVAWFAGSFLSGSSVADYQFVFTGICAMLISTLHLGIKNRAWRAILNLKNSWLSREVFSFSFFFGLAVLSLYLFPQNLIFKYLTVLFGAITLFSMDKVYHVIPTYAKIKWHSAGVFLTGVFYFSIFIELSWIIIIIGIGKLILYGYRKYLFIKSAQNPGFILSAIRLAVGLFFPIFLIVFASTVQTGLILILILLGEITDRVEFYLEMAIVTPAKEIEKSEQILKRNYNKIPLSEFFLPAKV